VSARLAREALAAFVSALEGAIGCVASTKLRRNRPAPSEPYFFEFETPGELVPLRGPLGLGLRVRLRAQIGPADASAREWRAAIIAYQYALLDGDGREYLTYHWHPDGVSHVTEPHLHFGPAAQVGMPALAAAHLPTGPVHLPAVVRLAVEAFRARPLRRDWSATLDAAAPSLRAARATDAAS
jgi:hypothetical protein